MSTTPHTPTRRRLRRGLLAAALAALALPAAASAATVGIAADGTLAYRGSDGEANSLSVRQLADAIEVTDSAAGVKPTQLFNSFAQLCVPVTSTTVRCGHRPVRIKRIAAALNDRNDVASSINTHLPVTIDGGSGTDSFFAGDGEAGEGDEIDGRHDAAEGGAADDELHAPRRSLAPYLFRGNGGNDTINGATGNDTVLGGAGGDTITTRGGNDRIVIGAGDFDFVDCGSGVDTVDLAGGGLIHVSCENRIGPAAG
jgi:Ca2+-binding RTX toxin-like protein